MPILDSVIDGWVPVIPSSRPRCSSRASGQDIVSRRGKSRDDSSDTKVVGARPVIFLRFIQYDKVQGLRKLTHIIRMEVLLVINREILLRLICGRVKQRQLVPGDLARRRRSAYQSPYRHNLSVYHHDVKFPADPA